MNNTYFPVGKLPPSFLQQLINNLASDDDTVILGPGTGLDCAVIDLGATYLVVKSDPITFTQEDIGWYLVHVNANDIATTGAVPRWLMVTLLLPEKSTDKLLVEEITEQLKIVCDEIGVVIIGGHTEITFGLDRPILAGTMLATVSKKHLITPKGIQIGDELILTKGVPIEATAILSRKFESELGQILKPSEIKIAQSFLTDPGVSVLEDAQIALKAGRVTGMHDPTEGGLASALWEMAYAGNCSLFFDPNTVPIPEISVRICQALDVDPLAAISSGALLISTPAEDSSQIIEELTEAGIESACIGSFEDGEPAVWMNKDNERTLLPKPKRDEVARLLDKHIV
ncbi:MAG: AIR synthase family protein [Anaerolineae bacterium]|nr:MAG: AIR synthase family protein [Anaerolineae bacterium]